MKTLALLIFLAGTAGAVADNNLLQNGDFSSGISHWEGDCHTPDSVSTDSPFTVTPSSGIVDKLRHFDWTKVTQDFDGKIGEYVVTITYTVSSDLKFSAKPDDYANIPGKVEFSRLMPFSAAPGRWVLIINDLGALHYHYWEITPKLDASGVQSIHAAIQLDSDDSLKKGFYLLFPPGQGLINLQSISLTPKTAANT